MVYFYFHACSGHTLQYYVWFNKSDNAIKSVLGAYKKP